MSTAAALIGVCIALVGLAVVIALTLVGPRDDTAHRAQAVGRLDVDLHPVRDGAVPLRPHVRAGIPPILTRSPEPSDTLKGYSERIDRKES